jgi:uncharacterized protein (TIGR02646 family)
MRYIDKSNRLLEWDAYVRDSNPSTWDGASSRKQLKLHKHLHLQQNGLCIYCEQKIKSVQGNTANATQPSHIEHILAKMDALFQEWQFEQDNLAMSCMGFREGKYALDVSGRVLSKGVSIIRDFCGHPKGNQMNYDLFIDPFVNRETHKYFNFTVDGEIVPSKKNPEKATYTIGLLNLNHADLVAWRLEVYNTLLEDVELDITNHLATYPIFYSMVKNLWGVA